MQCALAVGLGFTNAKIIRRRHGETLGSISHIALTVSDLERATAFYNKVFEFIGFKSVEVPESTQQAMKTKLKAWVGPAYSVSIRPSKGEFARRVHDWSFPEGSRMARGPE